MSGHIKVGGTWRSVSQLYTKVNVSGSSSWRSVSTGWVKVSGVWKKWYTALITDSFTRPNTGSLGSTDTGTAWNVLRGAWYTNGTQAVSDTAASSYPLAVVNLEKSDAIVSTSVSSGTGPAFWVSAAGSFWASTSFNTTSTYTFPCNPFTCWSFSYNWTCEPGTGGNGGGGGSYNISFVSNCAQLYAAEEPFMCGPYPVASWSCTDLGTSTCYDTCSGTSYNYFMRLTQSISNTVTNPVSDVNLGAQPAAIKVTTSGNSIVSQAYSDASMTTTLGSAISYTPTSPTTGTSHGIIKAPTTYNQQSIVDNFSVQ